MGSPSGHDATLNATNYQGPRITGNPMGQMLPNNFQLSPQLNGNTMPNRVSDGEQGNIRQFMQLQQQIRDLNNEKAQLQYALTREQHTNARGREALRHCQQQAGSELKRAAEENLELKKSIQFLAADRDRCMTELRKLMSDKETVPRSAYRDVINRLQASQKMLYTKSKECENLKIEAGQKATLPAVPSNNHTPFGSASLAPGTTPIRSPALSFATEAMTHVQNPNVRSGRPVNNTIPEVPRLPPAPAPTFHFGRQEFMNPPVITNTDSVDLTQEQPASAEGSSSHGTRSADCHIVAKSLATNGAERQGNRQPSSVAVTTGNSEDPAQAFSPPIKDHTSNTVEKSRKRKADAADTQPSYSWLTSASGTPANWHYDGFRGNVKLDGRTRSQIRKDKDREQDERDAKRQKTGGEKAPLKRAGGQQTRGQNRSASGTKARTASLQNQQRTIGRKDRSQSKAHTEAEQQQAVRPSMAGEIEDELEAELDAQMVADMEAALADDGHDDSDMAQAGDGAGVPMAKDVIPGQNGDQPKPSQVIPMEAREEVNEGDLDSLFGDTEEAPMTPATTPEKNMDEVNVQGKSKNNFEDAKSSADLEGGKPEQGSGAFDDLVVDEDPPTLEGLPPASKKENNGLASTQASASANRAPSIEIQAKGKSVKKTARSSKSTSEALPKKKAPSKKAVADSGIKKPQPKRRPRKTEVPEQSQGKSQTSQAATEAQSQQPQVEVEQEKTDPRIDASREIEVEMEDGSVVWLVPTWPRPRGYVSWNEVPKWRRRPDYTSDQESEEE